MTAMLTFLCVLAGVVVSEVQPALAEAKVFTSSSGSTSSSTSPRGANDIVTTHRSIRRLANSPPNWVTTFENVFVLENTKGVQLSVVGPAADPDAGDVVTYALDNSFGGMVCQCTSLH
jgi:hypothetical protein